MMGDLVHGTLARQQMVEVVGPACRVRRVVAIALHGGPAQHPLDPAAQPRRSRRLDAPERLDHPQHQRDVDGRDRQSTDHRRGVGLKRGLPLPLVLRILPAAAMGRQIGRAAGVEADASPGGRLLGAAAGERIVAFEQLLATATRGLARGGQVDQLKRTETEPVAAVVLGVAENPTRPVLQIQSAAVAQRQSLARRLGDLQKSQPMNAARHIPAHTCEHFTTTPVDARRPTVM